MAYLEVENVCISSLRLSHIEPNGNLWLKPDHGFGGWGFSKIAHKPTDGVFLMCDPHYRYTCTFRIAIKCKYLKTERAIRNVISKCAAKCLRHFPIDLYVFRKLNLSKLLSEFSLTQYYPTYEIDGEHVVFLVCTCYAGEQIKRYLSSA